MRQQDLEHLLEQAVAEALGLGLPPIANLHRRAVGKPHRTYPRKGVHRAQRPLTISTRYARVAQRVHT